jgi:hypothetical protein
MQPQWRQQRKQRVAILLQIHRAMPSPVRSPGQDLALAMALRLAPLLQRLLRLHRHRLLALPASQLLQRVSEERETGATPPVPIRLISVAHSLRPTGQHRLSAGLFLVLRQPFLGFLVSLIGRRGMFLLEPLLQVRL